MAPDQPSALIDPRALDLARRSLGPDLRVVQIPGDASTRRFYRVTADAETAILIVHTAPLETDAAFHSNHGVLASIGAPVPHMIGRDDGAGAVLVEDLGDTTLQSFLLDPAGGPRDPVAGRRRLYRQACDLILLLQERGTAALRPADFAARNALDHQRFLFEFDHFQSHFIAGLRGMSPSRGEETVLRDFYDEVATQCAGQRMVYCHRDFQSRNLMVRGGRLRLIDYQDARMGPYTYDAASLLRDSSLDLEEDLVQEMVAYLAERLHEPADEFRADFTLMSLQRNIKDLGTFAYMATVRGRRAYLEYVPRTLASIRRTLLPDRRFHAACPVLERLLLAPVP